MTKDMAMTMARARARDMAMGMAMDIGLLFKLPTAKFNRLFFKRKDDLKALKLKIFYFVHSQTARIDSQTFNIPIDTCKTNLQFLAGQLSTKEKAIEFFENECGELTEKRREETWEWLQQSYSPREIINSVLKDATCFDEELILKKFHQEIKELLAKADEL